LPSGQGSTDQLLRVLITKVDGIEKKVDGIEKKVDGLKKQFDGLNDKVSVLTEMSVRQSVGNPVPNEYKAELLGNLSSLLAHMTYLKASSCSHAQSHS
jgi:archaellum component FlaC